MEGINWTVTGLPTRLSTERHTKPMAYFSKQSTDTLQANVCRITSVCAVQKNKPNNHLLQMEFYILSRLSLFIREMTTQRYPELRKDHTIAVSASQMGRNLLRLLLLGEENEIRRDFERQRTNLLQQNYFYRV